MNTKIVYKDKFAVIGKMGQGPAENPGKWIEPLWQNANAHFSEISACIRHNEDGAIAGVWGAMNDVSEQNKRWDETGKYMAGCEADADTEAPDGWSKWVIPAQTYLVVKCTKETYAHIFGQVCNDKSIHIISTVHEYYPEPGNPNILEVYFPIAAGMLFCQSCGMPMQKDENFGTNKDCGRDGDYCVYCYKDGAFTADLTMEEMIAFCAENIEEWDIKMTKNEAITMMKEHFPKLKRWQTA